jgi:hypothetical protein
VYDPIKNYLKPYYLNAKFNSSQYYFMLVSENKVNLDDYMLYGDTVKKSFIETKIDYSANMEIPDGEGTTNAYISTYLMMDDAYRITDRKASTFMMAFSATGGFMTVTFLVTLIIV